MAFTEQRGGGRGRGGGGRGREGGRGPRQAAWRGGRRHREATNGGGREGEPGEREGVCGKDAHEVRGGIIFLMVEVEAEGGREGEEEFLQAAAVAAGEKGFVCAEPLK